MAKQISKHQKTWAKILAKAWSDELFKQKLISNPKAVLQEYDLSVPEGLNYKVHENTRSTHHLVIPEAPSKNLSEGEIKKIAAGACGGEEFYKA